MGCRGGQHGSSGRLCLVLIAGWAGVVGCILATHDFLPYRELRVNSGSRTLSQSEGILNGEGHLLGDVGRRRGGVGPVASLSRGRLAWCRAGLSHFPGLAGERGSLSHCLHPFPLASAVSLGHYVGSGDPDQQPMPDCTESFLGRRAVFPGQQAWVRHILPSFLLFFKRLFKIIKLVTTLEQPRGG